jgi:hypothetical protein
MSRTRLVLLLVIALMGTGCGYSSHNYMNGMGMPRVTQLSPMSIAHGSAAFTLTVEGTGFGTDSLVYWGTTTRTTTFDSATEVKADITADDLTNAGMVQVFVHSGGANSNALTFTIE